MNIFKLIIHFSKNSLHIFLGSQVVYAKILIYIYTITSFFLLTSLKYFNKQKIIFAIFIINKFIFSYNNKFNILHIFYCFPYKFANLFFHLYDIIFVIKRYKSLNRLRYLSYTDYLTGLHNRSSFEETLKTYNNEKYLPLGIIMGDVNGLKIVNDTLGHLEGDNLLKTISTILTEVCSNKGSVFLKNKEINYEYKLSKRVR